MNRITLTVPSTVHGNRPAIDLWRKNADKTLRIFAKLFGGATAIDARGAYMSSTGIIVENVTVVASYCDDEAMEAGISRVEALAEEICAEMTQECVAIEVNNTMRMVTNRAKAA